MNAVAARNETGNTKNIGLRGVPVADTRISDVDGTNGILIYRGYRIEDLAANATFEETAYLLLHDDLPNAKELAAFREALAAARQLPEYLVASFKQWPQRARPMDVLQASVPLLAAADPDLASEEREANLAMAVRLIARVPAVIAAWERVRKGHDPLPPDESLSHAGNFLWQLTGRKPDPETARELDQALILHADHSFNASTFACREVVSTRAHLYAGTAAGIGALSGSLHGGANAQVMKMLLELRDVPDIAGWVKKQLAEGGKIMGMGHAVYKTTDPRARFLREMGERMGKNLHAEQWSRILGVIEQTALAEFAARGKTGIKPNVDFFSAPVYHLMNIPHDLMTPVFAVARIAGWTAHMIEEKFGDAQGKPALYRPSSDYTGNYCGKSGCVYEPVEKRK